MTKPKEPTYYTPLTLELQDHIKFLCAEYPTKSDFCTAIGIGFSTLDKLMYGGVKLVNDRHLDNILTKGMSEYTIRDYTWYRRGAVIDGRVSYYVEDIFAEPTFF